MIATTTEQSRKLVELGIDSSTADMQYSTWTIIDGKWILSPNYNDTIEDLQEEYGNQIIPAWSLSALLDLLPINIDEQHYLFIDKDVWGESQIMYSVVYSLPTSVMNSYIGFAADSLIDAVFDMIVWLKENGKI